MKHTVQRYRTLVLRSDGVVCSFCYLSSPRGTPRQNRVLALSDGTLLSRAPVVDETRSTYSLPAITRFREARTAGKGAMTLTRQELLEGVHGHLQGSVVLAHKEDYALLAFLVLTSYAQAIFDAVPLVQVVGPGGADLGRTLAQVGCNACLVNGQTSTATCVRALDRLGGMAVIDDLEGIGRRSGKGEFNEFVRLLSASTRKDSASNIWTDPETMRMEKLDFYGVKVLINHSGTNGFPLTPRLRFTPVRLPTKLWVSPPLPTSRSCATTSTSG